MVTEQEAFDALPPYGWLRDYVLFAAKQTTAPLCYHIGVGLSLLAVSCPIGYGIRYATDIYPNVYVMIAGRSGEDQKSTAIRIGRDILFRAAPNAIGEHPASVENMIESLSKRATQMLIYEEGGSLLAGMQQGYREPLKPLFTLLADGDPVQHNRVSKKGQDDSVNVAAPRLSMLTGASLPFLERHTSAVDWTGGFLGRWLLFYGRRERTDPFPVPKLEGRDALVEGLKVRSVQPAAGWCMGPDAQSMSIWHDWYHDVANRHMPDLISGSRTRVPALALRVALLLGWDYGPAPTQAHWHLPPEILVPAIRIAELHIKSVVGLADRLASHPDAVLRRKVLDAIPFNKPTTLGEILKATKRRSRLVNEVLNALVEEDTIQRLSLPGGALVYMRESSSAD